MNQRWLDHFHWESETQRKGALALIKWMQGHCLPADLTPSDLFFIQKDHESSEWFCSLLADQVRALQDQIKILQDDVREIRGK